MQFRRGREAIEKATSRKGGGGGKFVPEIYFSEDGDKKYLLALTPIDEVPTVLMHQMLPVTRERQDGEEFDTWESVISRTDEAIGEDSDPISDEFDLDPKERSLGAVIELEPILKTVQSRKKVTGFQVATREFTRRTDDGEEDVEVPKIGVLCNWPGHIWGPLGSMTEDKGPLVELPLEVTQRGEKLGMNFEIVPYMDQKIDFSNLFDLLENLTYIEDELDDLLAELETVDDEAEMAIIIGRFIFEKRLEELGDSDRYDEIQGLVNEGRIKRWGDKKKGNSKKKPSARKKAERPSRPSARKKKEEKSEEEGAQEVQEDPEPEDPDSEPEEADDGDEGELSQKEKFDILRNRVGKRSKRGK